jgi:hypothetical protein
MIDRRAFAFAFATLALASVPAGAEANAIEAARIERLIQYVDAQRQIKFVRNGATYTGQEAALFLRGKFSKMGEHVGSAAQFIEQIASRSSTSGEPYLIRFADGRTVTSAQFLERELKRIDREH